MRFEGTLKEFELVSYAYDSNKRPLAEYEQRLSLKRDGAGRIECYTYAPKEECRNELFTVECRAASNLLNLIGTYASEYNRSILEWPDDNYGEWNLIMENLRGGLYRATGRLHPDIPAFSRDISNRIRELTGLAFLTAFDGGTGKR